jgi:hypothetical protein
MDRTEKLSLIARFESSIDPLVDFVKNTPAAGHRFQAQPAWRLEHPRPRRSLLWTRTLSPTAGCDLAVTQPGAEVFVWNEEAWQERAKYETADALACLEAARALRHVVCAMARSLVDADWEDYYVRHSQRGRMNLADVFKLYADHAQFHLSYFRRNLDAFKAAA